ncbi:MAG TPA: thiamine diphosphokinase [Anaerolineae bacterium]|nr:thiamine diphosphokinase [Anaerolineae bacterium]
MRAVIVANGPMPKPPHPGIRVQDEDLLICVDGGARNALALGLQPQVAIGDMDSMERELRMHLEGEGCRFVEHSPRKDETDSELAIRYALAQGATELVLLAALGGRIDHTLANVMLLALPELNEVRARLIDGNQELMLVRRETAIEGTPGDIVSLVPLCADAGDIHTEGLEYALHGGSLKFGAARGVSNVLVAARAKVKVGQGLLLLVHHHQLPAKDDESGSQGGC